MPKIKTHKATAKRFVVTKTGKTLHRKAGQGHFNARETGDTTRMKRRDITMCKEQTRLIKTLTPYK